jgi:hypothetical protein
MRWYFLSDTQEQIPTSEDQLPSLVASGLLRAQSLVWPEGTGDWRALGELKPELFTTNSVSRAQLPSAPKLQAFAAHQVARPLTQRYGWLVTCGGVLLVLALGCLVVAVMGGVGLFKVWQQQAHNLEGAGAASAPLGWMAARCGLEIFEGVMGTWMGLVLILGANRLRHGQLLGEAVASEMGLQALGKFFVLLTITVIVSALFVGVVTLSNGKFFEF